MNPLQRSRMPHRDVVEFQEKSALTAGHRSHGARSSGTSPRTGFAPNSRRPTLSPRAKITYPRRSPIPRPTESLPPATDRLDRELGRVVADSDRDPGFVLFNVVHAVRDRLALRLVRKIVRLRSC